MRQGLVGRLEEVARFNAAIDGLSRAGCVPFAIRGEPGIGKTRLLGELCWLGDEAGHLVLSGRAAQLERDVPFTVFVDALDGYLGAQNPRRLTPLGDERLIELARIFPSLAGLVEPGEGALQSERYRAHRAVAALLELLSRRTPVVVALDDLQWADDASLELVSHLLRRPPAGRLLLALARRRGEAPPGLSEALDDALREDRIDLIDLNPLSAAEATELMPEELPLDAREWLYRESGGNPFYLSQLQRSLVTGQPVIPAEKPLGPIDDVPPAVAAALSREVAELDPGAHRLLEGAAVAGDPFSLDLAAAAAEVSDAASREALDELLERELTQVTEEPRRFRFRHPIVRRTVYASASPGWRLGAHARVRDALERQGAPVTELAHHVEHAATPGDERAVRILERAGHATAPLAPAAAAHWFGAALSRIPEHETGRRLELLVPMASAFAGAGRLEESRSAVIRALDLLPEEAVAERVALISSLAAVDHLLGHHQEADQRLWSALGGLSDQSSPTFFALQVELAAGGCYVADWDRGLAAAEQARAAVPTLDRRSLRVVGEALRAMSLLGLERVTEAEDARVSASELLDSLHDSELAERLDGPYYLGAVDYFMERYEEGVSHLRRALAVARSTGQGQLVTQTKAGEAWCLIHLGRTREAIEVIEEALETAQLLGRQQALIWALGIRCWIARFVGDLGLALLTGEESVAIGVNRDEGVIAAAARTHLALAYGEAGEHERCIDEMSLAGSPDFPLAFPERKPFFYEALSRATLELGREDEAEAWAARAETLTDGLGLPVAVAAAQRSRARVLLARDDPQLAAELALAAVEGLDGRGARLEAARTRVLAGQALAAGGAPESATAELEKAFAELDACEAPRYRDEAARELRLLGRSMPRAGRRGDGEAGVGALSGRELEIAGLVAQAKTNREIAASLYISEKTVEKHLTKVFAKLEVPGRAAVGAKLAAGGAEGVDRP
ncbi:MAG TPA: AAA family ATPase [Solirubrobacterales bacterium]|jgi:ATP/maltotriose-dependent transcriptional regulator MalT